MKKKTNKNETISYFYNAYALAGGFETKDQCTDEYWRKVSSSAGIYIVLYDSNKIKIAYAGVYNLPGLIYNANGIEITSSINVQVPRIPLQRKRNDGTGITYAETSWFKQDVNNTRNANLVFKHTLLKDSNGNIIGMDSFTNYNSGDILYGCDNNTFAYGCTKLQIN